MGVMFAGSSEGGVCWVMIDRVMEPPIARGHVPRYQLLCRRVRIFGW